MITSGDEPIIRQTIPDPPRPKQFKTMTRSGGADEGIARALSSSPMGGVAGCNVRAMRSEVATVGGERATMTA